MDEIVERSFPDIDAADDPIAGLYRDTSVERFVGTRPDIVDDATPVEVTIDDTTSARTLVLAGGRIDAGPDTPVRAVVGLVDGIVVAASPPTSHPTGATGFLLVFPIDSSIAAEDVDLALVLDETTVRARSAGRPVGPRPWLAWVHGQLPRCRISLDARRGARRRRGRCHRAGARADWHRFLGIFSARHREAARNAAEELVGPADD